MKTAAPVSGAPVADPAVARRAGALAWGRAGTAMGGRPIRVARIAGIPVGISPWWLLVVALLTASLSAGYFPGRVPGIVPAAAVGLALASVLLVFGGVLAHEFAHALVARRHGVVIDEIDLWLLGGVARMRNQPRRAGDELRFALAGPALTAVLALAFGAVAWALPPSAPAALRAFVDYQLQVNLAIAGFNLLPALPLDGGRAARALAWQRTRDLRRATVAAARAGRAIGFALIYLGAFAVIVGSVAGLWTALIGGFLIVAATSEQRVVELEAALAGLTVEDVMSTPAVAVPAGLPLWQAREWTRRYGFASFPVVDTDGTVLGLLVAGSRTGTTAGAAADRDPGLSVAADEPAAALLGRPGFLRVGRAVVVDAACRPLGVVSLSDLQGRLRAASAAGQAARETSPLRR